MNLRNQKGITLMTEVITLVVFMIIIATITYSSNSSLQVRALNNMYSDIMNIQEKAANYYLKYGVAPVTDSLVADPTFDEKNPNDESGKYYKVDISKLPNMTLNNKVDGSNYYYMNTKTLTTYYSSGVTIDNLNGGNGSKKYYTIPSNYERVKALDISKYIDE